MKRGKRHPSGRSSFGRSDLNKLRELSRPIRGAGISSAYPGDDHDEPWKVTGDRADADDDGDWL